MNLTYPVITVVFRYFSMEKRFLILRQVPKLRKITKSVPFIFSKFSIACLVQGYQFTIDNGSFSFYFHEVSGVYGYYRGQKLWHVAAGDLNFLKNWLCDQPGTIIKELDVQTVTFYPEIEAYPMSKIFQMYMKIYIDQFYEIGYLEQVSKYLEQLEGKPQVHVDLELGLGNSKKASGAILKELESFQKQSLRIKDHSWRILRVETV